MNDFLTFRKIATITLSTLVGVLISLPFAQPPSGLPLLIVGALLGGTVGYRRRESRLFFYFVIFSVATLSTLIYFNVQ